MKTQQRSTKEAKDFVFLPRGQETEGLVLTPNFPTGDFADFVFDRYSTARDKMGEAKKYFKVEQRGQELVGSTWFDATLMGEVFVELGLRAPTPADLAHPWLLEAVRGKHYVVANAAVLRSVEDSYDSKNNELARSFADHVNLSRGPALISGYRFVPSSSDKGYGLLVVPAQNFRVVQDDRLNSKWHGYKFDEVDSEGLPLHLDRENGTRTWYTRDNGLSRFVLGSDLVLSSGWGDLDDSYPGGRVASFGGGAAARENYAQELRTLVEKKKSELEKIFGTAVESVERGYQQALKYLSGEEQQ
jgi:hypothetical protein